MQDTINSRLYGLTNEAMKLVLEERHRDLEEQQKYLKEEEKYLKEQQKELNELKQRFEDIEKNDPQRCKEGTHHLTEILRSMGDSVAG